MRAFLATVLSVIAVGVLLIAYGLLAPRASATSPVVYDQQTGMDQFARPMLEGRRVALPGTGGPGTPVAHRPAVYTTPVEYPASASAAPAPRTSRSAQAPPQVATRVDQPSGRDWTKTALVIGGSTATGAGIGAIVGGKKGALIGAAIGGGASTLWESKH